LPFAGDTHTGIIEVLRENCTERCTASSVAAAFALNNPDYRPMPKSATINAKP
jgi:hypothetical protein